jgi:tetratricopeptide (TPR) repeat protein
MNSRKISPLPKFVLLTLTILVLFSFSEGYSQSGQTADSPSTIQGKALFQAGDTIAAIAALRHAVEANPDEAEAWHFLGRCYNRLGRTEEAIQAFSRATKLRPSFLPSRVGLGLALQRANKLSESSREIDAALKLEPKCDECHYVLALIALKKGDQRKVWEQTSLALDINPNSTDARELRNQAMVDVYAQVLSPRLRTRETNTKQALLVLNFLGSGLGIIMDPSMATADFQRAQGDRFERAIDFYNQAIARDPNDGDVEEWRNRLADLRFWKRMVFAGEDWPEKLQLVPLGKLSSKPQPINDPKYHYPDDFRQAGIKGKVVIAAVVQEDGQTGPLLVLEPLHAILTQSALKAARQQKFESPKKNGSTVKSIVTLEYYFGVQPPPKK